jgi:hypothetical protein
MNRHGPPIEAWDHISAFVLYCTVRMRAREYQLEGQKAPDRRRGGRGVSWTGRYVNVITGMGKCNHEHICKKSSLFQMVPTWT